MSDDMGSKDKLEAAGQVADAIAFNDDGLVPAIAQQFDTGEVLMMAWMNREALELTVS